MKIFIGGRKYISGLISDLTPADLLKIPAGYKTNIFWNIGHLVATQQILMYSLSGVAPRVTDDFLNKFRKGTSPGQDMREDSPEILKVISLLAELPELLKEDHEKGMFKKFDSYTTSSGIILNNFEDAVAFNSFHDGIHAGIIQGIKKLL